MQGFSAQEQASMQAVVYSAMDMTVSTQRASEINDGQGGRTESWVTSIASMPARIRTMSATEVMTGGQLLGKVQKVMLYEPSYDVRHRDRVIAGGVTYQVTAPPGNTSYGFLYQAEMEKIEEQS